MKTMTWLRWLLLALCGVFALTTGCKNNTDDDDDSDAHHCLDEDATACQDGDLMLCIGGVWVLQEACADFCDPEQGCLLCPPGEIYCNNNKSMQCAEDGMSEIMLMDCDEFFTDCVDGVCYFEDACDEADAWQSNIGCEYWAADLDNAENFSDDAAAAQFAVAVANIAGEGNAHVDVHINLNEQGDGLGLERIDQADVPPGEMHIFLLPRRDVDGENITDNTDDGPQTWLSSRAFRITSDLPIVAYQFNTLDQQFSNDASLMLPTSGLGKNHLVATYPPSGPFNEILPGFPGPANRGYVTILGTADDTVVQVTPMADIVAGEGVPEVADGIGIYNGQTATFTIHRFDVLNLETMLADEYEPINLFGDFDLTGTTVVSSEPVTVFTGADLAMVVEGDGEDTCCAEHFEQQIIPSKAMSDTYVVSRSAPRCEENPESDFYRIMAFADGTTVQTSLPTPGDDNFVLMAGQYKEFFVNHGFTVEADGPIHVAQFLVVGTEGCYVGDSALLYVPALEQRRPLYIFTTGQGFSENWAVLSVPQGVTALLDGMPVATPMCSGPHPEGTIDGVVYEGWTCPIEDGVHMAHSGDDPDTATENIAVYVYGYYSAGSYAYPAGADLRTTNSLAPE